MFLRAVQWYVNQCMVALQAHELFQAIKPKLLDSFPPAAQFVHDVFTSTSTPVTTVGRNGKVSWRNRPRPFVVISSTSWTPDEDFGVCFSSLSMLLHRAYLLVPNVLFSSRHSLNRRGLCSFPTLRSLLTIEFSVHTCGSMKNRVRISWATQHHAHVKSC